MKISHLAVAFALTGSVHAAGFIDNFESYSPLYGNMNGQGGWVVTNGVPANPGDGPVVIVDNYTWDGSDQSATVGGWEPTALGITSLTHSVSGVSLEYSVASWEMSFTESTDLYPHNAFSFVVDSTAGNLLTIYLAPSTPGIREVSWTSGLSPDVVSGYSPGLGFGTIAAGDITQFQIVTWWNGTKIQFDLSNAGSTIATGYFDGASMSDSLTTFSANWYTYGGAGNNSITLDNVSVIPEPSAALLGIMGMSLLFSRRRRA